MANDSDAIEKLFVAFLHRADESTLGRVLVEGTILLSASPQQRFAGSPRCSSGL
ncbi:MAG: hypothetical protein QOJ51_5227 [Acidobacteriaceae bacterium]|jgi:hypothetical protein|nr:hypothetical protein [Acidobacteriaceae bacterium]